MERNYEFFEKICAIIRSGTLCAPRRRSIVPVLSQISIAHLHVAEKLRAVPNVPQITKVPIKRQFIYASYLFIPQSVVNLLCQTMIPVSRNLDSNQNFLITKTKIREAKREVLNFARKHLDTRSSGAVFSPAVSAPRSGKFA